MSIPYEEQVSRTPEEQLAVLDDIAEYKDGWKMPGYKPTDPNVLARARTLVSGTPSLPEKTQILLYWETGELRLVIDPPHVHPKIVVKDGVGQWEGGTESTRLEAVLVVDGTTILRRERRGPGAQWVPTLAQDHFDDADIVRFLNDGLLPTEQH